MPSSVKPIVLKAAEPRHGKTFDPWNSSATGHQRPETRVGLGWRQSRNRKLMGQFVGGHSGGERLSDTYGAGSEDFDQELGLVVPKNVRARAKVSVKDMLAQPGRMKETINTTIISGHTLQWDNSETTGQKSLVPADDGVAVQGRKEDEAYQEAKQPENKIFEGVVVYVNGNTAPHISDHKLKRVLAENGAKMSLHLGRRQVTHVIVGRPVGAGFGSGGGLAGGKLEREIKKYGGCAVKYVGVDWVLESLKAGKRLSESKFASFKVARAGQKSVLGIYSAGVSTPSSSMSPSAAARRSASLEDPKSLKGHVP